MTTFNYSGGQLVISGGVSIDALSLTSTDAAFGMPVLTTTQRNALSPAAGDTIYNSTSSVLQIYNGSTWDDAGGGGGGLANVVEDTTPQLGGQLDVNGFSLGDGTLELLKFVETASAVNEITVTNAATGNAPSLSATGDDTNIDLNLVSKGAGVVKANGTAVSLSGHTHAYLANVVEDTTPQLGGNLDVQSSIITTSTTNGNITIDPNGTGNVALGNFTFDGDQTVGAGQDNYVMTYDHAAGTVGLEAAAGGGGDLSWTLLTTVNVSSSTVSISLSGYTDYLIVFENFARATGTSGEIFVEVNHPTYGWVEAPNSFIRKYSNLNSATPTAQVGGGSGSIGEGMGNGISNFGEVHIKNNTGTLADVVGCYIVSRCCRATTASYAITSIWESVQSVYDEVIGIRFKEATAPVTDTFDSGTFKVYGRNTF